MNTEEIIRRECNKIDKVLKRARDYLELKETMYE